MVVMTTVQEMSKYLRKKLIVNLDGETKRQMCCDPPSSSLSSPLVTYVPNSAPSSSSEETLEKETKMKKK